VFFLFFFIFLHYIGHTPLEHRDRRRRTTPHKDRRRLTHPRARDAHGDRLRRAGDRDRFRRAGDRVRFGILFFFFFYVFFL